MSEDGTEGDYIGWDYSEDDIQSEERERTGNLNDFEKMLAYHEITASEFNYLSNNQQRQMWWNYRKFGDDSDER